MNFGIDFDDTLSSRPALWKVFYDAALAGGDRMYCISCRRNTIENFDIINTFLDTHGMQMIILLTSLRSKQAYVDEMGLKIDIWIDDMPRSITEGR